MVSNMLLTDNEVISYVLQGKKSMFELVVRKYNPYLYKIGRSYNYNHDDTEDLMQDTYIDAFKHLAQFEQRSDFKTWIIRIMLNNCYRKNKKSSYKNEIMKDINENSKPLFHNYDHDTGSMVHNAELKIILEDVLKQLPEDYRMVFALREITGLSVAETADSLHISQANVKVRLNRAKNMLRELIEKSYKPTELFEYNDAFCNPMTDKVMKIIENL